MSGNTDINFVKRGDPDALSIELAKSTSARSLGEATGSFYVPRVEAWDDEAGVLEFERLPSLRRLNELIAEDDPAVPDLLGRLGGAIAVAHSGLELPEDMRRAFPEEWFADGGPGVFVHGDLTTNNVCWDSADDRLIIVDWSTTPTIDPLATVAPACFDAHWFIFHLFYSIALRSRLMPDSGAAADRFIEGYRAVGDLSDEAYSLLKPTMATYYKRQIATTAGIRSPMVRLPYTAAQNVRYASWTRYQPPRPE